MPTVDLAERPDLKTSQTLKEPQAAIARPEPASQDNSRPEAHAVPQALSHAHSVAATQYDPFDAYSGAQPSDHGYDDYGIDPKSLSL